MWRLRKVGGANCENSIGLIQQLEQKCRPPETTVERLDVGCEKITG